MPSLLRRDAIKLLDGGLECYILSLCGANIPNLRNRRFYESRYAPVIGLLGAAVELLIKACLIQAKGPEIMIRDDGFYKYGRESIDEFRHGINKSDKDFAFLWNDTDNPNATRETILDYTLKFRMLQTLRANGLHAGVGPSRDVVIITVNDVYDFIQLLSQSKRLKPYFKSIPKPELPITNRAAIIEDLNRRLLGSTELDDKAGLLRSIYLVLPHVPDIEPEWLKVFEKVSVTPTEKDLSYLVTTLADAHGVHLLKQRGGGQGIPVTIEPNNPNAIPISIQYLKRELTQISDQFYADIASANGRLKEGFLDLPPDDVVYDLFTIGFENTPIFLDAEFKLTAQQTWPFIASAISVQGTPRPYWFLIKQCNELQKLKTIMIDIVKYGNGYYRNNIDEIKTGIDCLTEAWPKDYSINKELKYTLEKYTLDRNKLRNMIIRELKGKYRPDIDTVSILEKLAKGEERLGIAIQTILKSGQLDENKKKWVKSLAPFSYKYDDRSGLLAILRTDDLLSLHTMARKFLRLIDVLRFGPLTTIDRILYN